MSRISGRGIVASVAFAGFITQLDSSIVNVALPTISRYFGIGPGRAAQVSISYLLMATSTLLVLSKLADRVGLKKIFIAGYLVFVLGSLMCGLAPTITFLVISRYVQGLGAAMLYTTSFAVIPKFLARELTGRAFGVLTSAAALGMMAGAPIGGLITTYFSWRWIFLVNLPVGLIAAVVASRSLPHENSPGSGQEYGTFDVYGALLSSCGLVAFVYGLGKGHGVGWYSPATLGCFGACFVLLCLFFVCETKHHAPILDLTLFNDRGFAYGCVASSMGLMLLGGTLFLMPFYLELEKGLKTEQVGLLLMIHSLVMVGLGPVAGKLSDRRDPRIICTFAMTLGAATCLEFFCTLELQSLFWVLLYLVSMSASLALFISPSNNLAMGLAPKGKHAIAAGVYGTVTRLGLMLGVSFFEVIFSGFTRAGPSAGEKLSALTASPAALVRGFRYAYLFGAFLCILTACCCLLGRREMRKENALEPAAMG